MPHPSHGLDGEHGIRARPPLDRIVDGVGRPRAIVDVALAVRLVGHGHTDRAAARRLGVSPWTVRLFRRGLPFGRRRGGRSRRGEPDIVPARGRASLVPVTDEQGRVIGHRLGAIAA